MTATTQRVLQEIQPRAPLREARLTGVVPITSTAAIVLTVGEFEDFQIEAVTLTNSSAATTVFLYFVPPGGSRSTSNVILNDFPVAQDATIRVSALDGVRVGPGAEIHVRSAAASGVNLTLWGYEYGGEYG